MSPDLTNVEVKRLILNSAKDIETPGRDQFTGYGIVDAIAALKADPAFEIMADISAIEVLQEGKQMFVAVTGTANANQFDHAEIFIGQGEAPTSWKAVGERINDEVYGAGLAQIPASEFRAAPVWTIRLVMTHKNGEQRAEWFTLTLG